MRYNLKLAILSAAIFSATSAWAGDVDSFLENKTDSGFNKIIDKAYKSDAGRDSIYADINDYVKSHDTPQDVSKANELMINVTSMIFPQFAGYWDNVALWQNVPVYQNHDLYDMDRFSMPERFSLPKSKINSIDGKNEFAMVNGAMSGLSHSPYGSSEHLMKLGLPGVGPDGKPIQICRLVRSKNAPYVEISYSDAKSLYPIIGTGKQPTDCLSTSLTQDYWKSRRADFFNQYGDIVSPPRTLEQF